MLFEGMNVCLGSEAEIQTETLPNRCATVLDSLRNWQVHTGRTHARDDQRPHQCPSTEAGA